MRQKTHLTKSIVARLALVLAACLTTAALAADKSDWPQFRGPARNGITTCPGLLTTWSAAGPKKMWTGSVGLGYSGVAVAGGRAFTMGNSKIDGKDSDTVFCFDAQTGQPKWKQSYPAAPYTDDPRCRQYPGPGATPTVDGELVYTLSRDGQLYCFKAATGEIAWHKNLVDEYKIVKKEWMYGFAGSPLVVGKQLILQLNAGAAALEIGTGKPIWHWHDDDADCGGYASPVLFDNGGTPALAILGKSMVALSTDGKELWRVSRWQPYDHGLNATDPLFLGSQVFLSQGNYTRSCGVFSFGKGRPDKVWRNGDKDNGPMLATFHTPILYNGNLYGWNDDKLACVEFKTGKTLWEEKGLAAKYGSLIMADDKLLVVSDRGELLIVKADPSECKILARAQLIDKSVWTTPSLAGGLFYVRNIKGDVACYELKK